MVVLFQKEHVNDANIKHVESGPKTLYILAATGIKGTERGTE
jgi:hypothetical protein